MEMNFEYTDDGKVIVSMKDYMRKLVEEFPLKITQTSPTPATEELFVVGKELSFHQKKRRFSQLGGQGSTGHSNSGYISVHEGEMPERE